MTTFPYTPHRMDGTKLAPWFDHTGTGEYGPEVPVSIRNAVAERNMLRIARCDRMQFELAVEAIYPEARIYGDRFGAVALVRTQRGEERIGTYTRDARHGSVALPDHLCI